MLLLLDNGSAYSDELESRLSSLGCALERLAPRRLGAADLGAYSAFVLSGRSAPDRVANVANARAVAHARAAGAPLLGVCYGAEVLAQCAGGTLRRMASPRRGMRTVRLGSPGGPCAGEIEAYESHAYEIARLPEGMECLASSDECAVEAVHAAGTRMYGTQFHPEMSSDGAALLGAFVRMAFGGPAEQGHLCDGIFDRPARGRAAGKPGGRVA